MKYVRPLATSLVLVSSSVSCMGTVGDALRPDDHTALSATGAKSPMCTGGAKQAKPLIVDLDPDTRVDLEATMKKGVAVVAYDCKTFRVLPACKVAEAAYEYAGVSRKEQVIQMNNLDDLSVNLPISSAKFGAEMTSGRSIDLALVRVGMSSTALAQITRAELAGGCDGATHFVQSATVGAFSMSTGSVGKAGLVAEMFGASAAAKSESERKAMSKDGSLDDCRKSDPDGSAPPSECRAPLQVELIPILGAPPAAAAKDDDGKKGDKAKSVGAAESPCPDGYNYTDGMCTRGSAQAHLCDPKNEAECAAQCDKGNAESCLNLGRLRRASEGAAIMLYKKACDGGAYDGCGALAIAMMPEDDESPTIAADARAGVAVAHRGCEGGSGFSCDVEGDYMMDTDFKIRDVSVAVKAYGRGCKLGYGTACYSLAKIYFAGQDLPRDAAKGLALLTKACQSGNADECATLAVHYKSGSAGGSSEGVSPDPVRELAGLKSACLLDPSYCDQATRLALAQGKHADALALADRGCAANDRESCYNLGIIHEEGKGVAPDAAKAKAAFTKACDGGDGRPDACGKLGAP